MSYQLAFWAYDDGRRSNRVADRRTYLKLVKGRRVKDIAPLETDRVLDSLAIVYGTWRRSDTYHFSHPSQGSFDVWVTGGMFVVLTFHNVKDLTVMNPAIEVLDALGAPLYDPQVDRRFPGWHARPSRAVLVTAWLCMFAGLNPPVCEPSAQGPATSLG